MKTSKLFYDTESLLEGLAHTHRELIHAFSMPHPDPISERCQRVNTYQVQNMIVYGNTHIMSA
ncbi:MAG: hypothetical protein ABJF11_20630, partial [Reichenbachiella sp.]|uniref:hypothetical protein n=1 Tax=Reichenbachiella sp. TaxID=2184521 RepID=UPI0032671A08